MRSLQVVCIIFNNVYYSAITSTKGVLVPARRGPWYRFWLSLFQTVREGGIKWRHPSDGLGTRLRLWGSVKSCHPLMHYHPRVMSLQIRGRGMPPSPPLVANLRPGMRAAYPGLPPGSCTKVVQSQKEHEHCPAVAS